VNENYRGLDFDLRGNSELGIEDDYVDFLTQGVAIDYAIIAPFISMRRSTITPPQVNQLNQSLSKHSKALPYYY